MKSDAENESEREWKTLIKSYKQTELKNIIVIIERCQLQAALSS